MQICSGCTEGWCAGCVPDDSVVVMCPHCLKPLLEGQEVAYEPDFASVIHLACSCIWNEHQIRRMEAERKAEEAWSQVAL
jgi:hypothetical protein